MIRAAQYKDFETIKKIFNVSFDKEYQQRGVDIVNQISRWQKMYPLIKTLSYFPNPYQYVFNVHVYEEDGKILGLVQTSSKNKENTRWHIDNIAVLPEYRGRGIAHELLEFIFDLYSKNKKISQFTLEVDVKNEKVIRLYKSLGFRIYSTVHYYYLTQKGGKEFLKNNKNITLPVGFRSFKPKDYKQLLSLYEASTPTEIRIAEQKQLNDFKDSIFFNLAIFLKRQLKRSDQQRWVVETPGGIVAFLEIISQYRDLPHVIRLMTHPGYEDLNENLINFSLMFLSKFPPRQIMIAALEHQNPKKEILKSLKFKLVTSDHLMVKDNLKIIKLSQTISNPTKVDDILKPAFIENRK